MVDEFADFPKAGDAVAQDDEFADFAPAQSGPSFSQQAGAAAEAGTRSAIEGVSIIGSTATGARLGTLAAPFTGPLAPAMPFIGAAGGLAYGLYAGETAAEGAGLRSPEQMPPDLRAAGYFGQSVGGAAPFAVAPFGAAASGFRFGEPGFAGKQSIVGTYLNQIIETAKTRPVTTAVTEASAAISAATAAGLSEAIAPGQGDARVIAETTAGVLNPTRLVVSMSSHVFNMTQRAITSISPAAQQTQAAKVLQDLLARTGEDPTAIARALRSQNVVGTPQTAAQKTGSLALSALEDYLAKHSDTFGPEAGQKARDSMDSVRGMITLLSNTGDPAAMSAAAEAQTAYYRMLIQGRLDAATGMAQATAQGISVDTPAAREALSIKAREALGTAVKEARAAETELWEKVDGTRKVEFSNLQSTYDDILAELLPEVRNEKTPEIVRKFLTRVGQPKEGQQSLIILPENVNLPTATPEAVGTNVKEMRQLRSELLDLARSSTNAGEYGQARIYSNLAESVLDDMDAAFREAGDTAYNEARTFSREFNDVFTRSFAGRATAQGKYGNRIAPELMLRKALSTGKEAGAMQLQELEEATRFMQIRGLGDDTAAVDMLDAQERILRLAAADAIDPVTGIADPKKLAKFARDNETLMLRFPEVKKDILNAQMSETARQRMENLAKRQVTVIEQQKAFGRMLASDPVTMASKALVSTDQERQLMDLINIAKQGYKPRGGVLPVTPKQATDGLRASIFDASIRRATDKNGVLNLAQFRGLLFSPSVPGQRSPMQILQQQGVVDAKQVSDIKKLLDAADNIVRSQAKGTAVEVDAGLGDAALATISRMIGSGLAGGAARMFGSGTPSLIVHGAGAKFAETTMTKLPVTSVQKLLVDAVNDPEKLALLLEKVDTPAKAAMQARQIHAWLVQSGLTGLQQSFGLTQEPEAPEFFSQPR